MSLSSELLKKRKDKKRKEMGYGLNYSQNCLQILILAFSSFGPKISSGRQV